MHLCDDNTQYIVNHEKDEHQMRQRFGHCKQIVSFVDSKLVQELNDDCFHIFTLSEAIITHDVDVRKLIVDLSTKAKEYNDADDEEKKKKKDWQKCFRTVIFVVRQKSFTDL